MGERRNRGGGPGRVRALLPKRQTGMQEPPGEGGAPVPARPRQREREEGGAARRVKDDGRQLGACLKLSAHPRLARKPTIANILLDLIYCKNGIIIYVHTS